MIVSFNTPTNISEESDITTFYGELPFLARNIPKGNVQITDGEMKAQISQNENNKFCLYNLPNRNSEYISNFSLENSLSRLNT